MAKADVAVSKDLSYLLKATVSSTTPVTGLAHHDANGTNENLGTGYIDANGHFQPIHGDNDLVLSSTFTVTLEVDWTEIGEGTHGWNNTHTVYTEGNISYSLADIQNSLNGNSMKVWVQPSENSRIRFFSATLSSDTNYSDMTKKDSGTVSVGEVDNITSSETKGYALVGTATLTNFGSTASNDSKTASVTSTFKYYVLGKQGNSDNNKDTDSGGVNGPIDIIVRKAA